MSFDKNYYIKKFFHYKKNPVDFLEECVKIPTPGGSELIKLYEPQKRIVEAFFEKHYLILLKSRQIGMSTLCQALITYLFTFYKNCVVGIVSRDRQESSDFCRKVEDMIDNLPDWIRPKYKNKSVQYFIMNNGNQLFTSAVSPANPGAVFRSKSITLLIIDEAAHIRNIEEAWTGIASTLSKTHIDAKNKGVPFGTIILSTPNKTVGIGSWFYKMWTSAKMGENNFSPFEIHWKEIPAFREDPEWFTKQCKILNNDRNKIAQELELKFIGGETNLFDDEVQIRLQTYISEPKEILEVQKVPGEKLSIFKKIQKEKFYLIGVDCASAGGSDFSAIEVMDYETTEQVAEYFGKVDPKKLLQILKYVCYLFPNNEIIIENTGGYGHSVIYDLVYDSEFNYNLFQEETDKNKIKYGLSTNAKTRPLIMDALYTYVKENTDITYSRRLSTELLNLVKKNDRIEADKGFNDDCVLAYAFCCYVRKYCSHKLFNTAALTKPEEKEYINEMSKKILMDYNEIDSKKANKNYYSEFLDSFEKLNNQRLVEEKQLENMNKKILEKVTNMIDNRFEEAPFAKKDEYLNIDILKIIRE